MTAQKQKAVDYQGILRDIATSMVRLKHPERLLKMVTRFLDKSIGLTHTSILVFNEDKRHFVFVDSKGSRRFPVGLIRIDMNHPLILWFGRTRRGKRKDDSVSQTQLKELMSSRGERPGIAGEAPFEEAEKLLANMQGLKVELAIPAYYKENMLGLLLLGRKTDGQPFTAAEISFFQILAQDCSMAFKTAEYHRDLVRKNEELETRLAEIEKLRAKEQKTYYQIMCALAQEVHVKDTYTFCHINYVEELGLLTAEEMELKMTTRQKDILKASLILHDVGKIGVPDHILKKEGALTGEEWEIMRCHAEKGAKIVEPLEDFQEVAKIIRAHHENFDGTGYPSGLKGDRIPMESRIVAVVDSFHAMVSHRTYCKGRSVEAAFEELRRCAGTQFDPVVVEAFIRSLEREIKKRGKTFFLEEIPEGHAARFLQYTV